VTHRTTHELLAGVAEVRRSPSDDGKVELIVCRPARGVREVLEAADLDLAEGLVGDMWSRKPSSKTGDGSPHPDMQITLMNARFAALVAVDPERRALAGDQLYVDLDLGGANLPPGTRLALGDAVVEITAIPHPGCAKFGRRFGSDAMEFVLTPVGRELNLRGVMARVAVPGTVKTGDMVRKL
jgi:MOSC domain